MAVRVWISLLFFWGFLIFGSGYVYGDVYNHCPDCTELCYVEECPFGISGSGCTLECPPWQLCYNQYTYVPHCHTLKSIWNGTDVPFEGSEENNKVRKVNSAEVSITMRSFQGNLTVTVKSWNCKDNEFVSLETVEVKGLNTRAWNVTEHFLSCINEYKIGIEFEVISEYKYLLVHEVNLSVDYDLEDIYGQLSASLYTNLPPSNTIEKYKSLEAISDVGCSGGYCGDVWVELQYAEYPGSDFTKVPVGSGTAFFTESNPFDLGPLDDGEQSHKDWIVYTNKTGSYLLKAVAYSENQNVESDESNHAPVRVRVGELSVSNVHFYPNPTELGYNTTLYANVSCKDYYCGYVDVYAKNGTSKIVPLPNKDDYFVLYDYNPQTKTMIGNSYFEVSWELTPKFSGEYTNIYVSADSDEEGVYSIEGYPLENLVVAEPSPVYGSLYLENTNLYPAVITQGAVATLSGMIVCSGGPCGDVWAYAQQAGEDIPLSGEALTTPENPKQPQSCLDMQEGSSCYVSWEITGNEDGIYDNIRILANSENPEVYNKTSRTFTLTVEKTLGDIYVDANLEPSQINISEYAEVSGILDCSTEYCGILTASLEYSAGGIVGYSGNLSTDDPNPVACENPPCGLLWNVLGNTSGLYEIKVSVQSNESIINETDKMTLFVNDPGTPPEPTLYISTIQDIQYPIGSVFSISADVICYGSNCGETTVYIQYKDGSQQWYNLTSGTVLNTQENAKTAFLEATDSETFVWLINSTQGGIFEMRIAAESQFADGVFKEFQAEIMLPGVIAIQILSPMYSLTQFFSRGDNIPLKILVTDDGGPKPGLNPIALFSGSLYPKIALDDLGDGTYSSSIDIPTTAEGDYIITFEVNDVQKSVNIVVDPSLDVTLNTDRHGYKILETMVVSGTVLKKGIPVETKADIELNCSGWRMVMYNIKTGSDGSFEYDYRLPHDIPPGACSLKVKATDDFGNTGSSSTEINISKSELDVYGLRFINPLEGQIFSSGDGMNVTVRVLFNSIPVEHAEVVCTDVYGNFKIILNRSIQGEYSTTTKAERKPGDNTWTLRCIAETSDGLFGSGFVNIVVRPKLQIDVIEPGPDQKETEKGETLHIILQVSYSDFGYMEDGSVLMTIGNESVTLNYTWNGIYETYYRIPSEGELSFAFLARDNLGNAKTHTITITSVSYPRVNWLAIIMVLAGILILVSLWFANKTKKGKTIVKTVYKTVVKGPDRKTILQNKIKDLEKEKRAIEKAKEEAEMEYYQRKLTEAGFKKMMENYEQELLKIEAEIQEFRSEMESLK